MCSEESHSSLGDSVFNGSPRVVEEEQAADVNLEESAKMPWLELVSILFYSVDNYSILF